MTVDQAYKMLIEYGIATPGELRLVTHLVGYRLDVLTAVLKTRTGYEDLDQFAEDYESGKY